MRLTDANFQIFYYKLTSSSLSPKWIFFWDIRLKTLALISTTLCCLIWAHILQLGSAASTICSIILGSLKAFWPWISIWLTLKTKPIKFPSLLKEKEMLSKMCTDEKKTQTNLQINHVNYYSFWEHLFLSFFFFLLFLLTNGKLQITVTIQGFVLER